MLVGTQRFRIVAGSERIDSQAKLLRSCLLPSILLDGYWQHRMPATRTVAVRSRCVAVLLAEQKKASFRQGAVFCRGCLARAPALSAVVSSSPRGQP